MKKLALLFSLAALTVMGFSCAKKDNNNNPTYQMTINGCADQNGNLVSSSLCGYQYVNGQCVQISTYQPAPTQYCNSGGVTGNSMYSCVQSQTGQTVPNQYCLTGTFGYTCVQTANRMPVQSTLCSQTNGGIGGVMQVQCTGQYAGLYQYNGMTYQCGITTNCAGYLMTVVQTQMQTLQPGQQVQCM